MHPTPARVERDLLGDLAVPEGALHGIHGERALANHPILGRPVHPALIRAYAQVKLACLRANVRLGHLPAEVAPAIEAACAEMIDGRLGIPPIDAYQGGAGTSTNLAVSEVLANRAQVLRGGQPGDPAGITASGSLNLHQSTNDTYQAALRVAGILLVRDLETAITALQDACQDRERAWAEVVCLGRTEGMDAVLITMGRRAGCWADALGRDRWRMSKCEERLRVVALGGTAVGTGIGAPRDFILSVTNDLRAVTGLNLARAENLMDAVQNQDALVEVHGIATALATTLLKVCGDLRLLSSGPQGGLGELHLPARQAGSSLMPGKINPVVPEAATQAALRVLGNHQVLAHAAGLGSLELNPFAPLLAETLLESLGLLANSCRALARDCIPGLTVVPEQIAANAQADTALVTALVGDLGYQAATAIAAEQAATGEALVVVAARHGIDAARWIELTRPERVLRLGDRPIAKGPRP